MKGWKIALLAFMAGLGAIFIAGGIRTIVESFKLWSQAQGGELAVGIGVTILVAALLLFLRWRHP
jgi:hypothetical protein